MKKTLISLCLFATPFLCHAAQPSQESIEKLLDVGQTHKLIDGMIPQMEGMMKSMVEKTIDGQNLSPADKEKAKAAAASMAKKMMPIMKEALNWEKVKKVYIPIYRDTFTQEEIDGLIAFYSSPAGKALVDKMPIVLQKSMTAMQELIGPMLQQVQKAAAETAEEIKHQNDAKQ